MTRPGFRKGRPGGGRGIPAADATEGFVSSALFSQAQILHLMKNEFARARRHGLPLACLLLQVDRLPQLVDLYGSELRQRVRQAVANLVRDKTRGADLMGLTHDDRYLLVLPHTAVEPARIVANRLLGLFHELEFTADGRELALTLSIGISSSGDQQTMFFDSMVAQAELALEFCVQRGGNRIATFGETQLQPDDEPGRRDAGVARREE